MSKPKYLVVEAEWLENTILDLEVTLGNMSVFDSDYEETVADTRLGAFKEMLEHSRPLTPAEEKAGEMVELLKEMEFSEILIDEYGDEYPNSCPRCHHVGSHYVGCELGNLLSTLAEQEQEGENVN